MASRHPPELPATGHLVRIPGEDFVPGMRAAWARHWNASPYFRRYITVMTLMFSAVFLVEGALRIWAAYSWPIPVTLAVFQVEGTIVWPLLFIPVIAGFRRAKRRGREEGFEVPEPDETVITAETEITAEAASAAEPTPLDPGSRDRG